MEFRTVHVTAPSRLHFGLFSFGHARQREFGGVGVMVDQPAVELSIEPGSEFSATGTLSSRVAEFASRWSRFYDLTDLPTCKITVEQSSPQHVGLGVGTQLGLSVAAGLQVARGLDLPSPIELASSVNRGLRSAVGTYGFCHGGLIVERGKLPNETLAPLDGHIDLPEEWRFVLIRPSVNDGLSGDDEKLAFSRLPSVPVQTSDKLIREVREHLVPAAVVGDFESFSQSLFRYGCTAGSCFSPEQNGKPFNGNQLTRLVETIREIGIEGVGQSSWGPTLFAVLPSLDQASEFVERLRTVVVDEKLNVAITRPNNSGASISVVGEPVGSSRVEV